MYDEFTQKRIAQLRTVHGSTARDMSLSLGQSESYINKIENKKSLPSMQVFFYICDYFGITPQEFFDQGNTCPERLRELLTEAKKLDGETIAHFVGIMKRINNR